MARQGPPPAPVRVDAARLEPVLDQRMVTGELRAVQRARVATQEPGLVLELLFEEGHAVKKGDLLARLDSKRLELDLRELEAQEQVASATADERRAESQWRQRDLETYQSLSRREVTNPKELYDAEAQASIAQAKLVAAEQLIGATRARADLLRKRIDDTSIKAPFDGVVIAKLAQQGEWVDEGEAVAELIGVGTLDAWLDVPQKYASALVGKQPPPQVTINVEATGASIQSDQVRAVPAVDSKARSFAAIVRLDNADGSLAAGMSVTAWVPTGATRERLTISKDAVLRNDVGNFVYVARQGAAGTPPMAAPVQVQVLFALNDRFVVEAQGVAAGDLVVVEGNERLFPMAPLAPLNAPASEPGRTGPAVQQEDGSAR